MPLPCNMMLQIKNIYYGWNGMPLPCDMTLQIKIFIMDAMECPLPCDMTLQMEMFIMDAMECPLPCDLTLQIKIFIMDAMECIRCFMVYFLRQTLHCTIIPYLHVLHVMSQTVRVTGSKAPRFSV